MPSKRLIFEIACGVALLAALAWLHQHDARIRAEAVSAQIEQDRRAATAERDEALKAVEREKDAVKTPEQAVRIINRYVPLPVPISVPVNLPTEAAALPSTLQEEKPDAPVAKVIEIPEADAVPLAHYVEECRECEIRLAAAEDDNQRVTEQRDAARRALKGGTWLERLTHNFWYLALGGGGATALMCATGHCK